LPVQIISGIAVSLVMCFVFNYTGQYIKVM